MAGGQSQVSLKNGSKMRFLGVLQKSKPLKALHSLDYENANYSSFSENCMPGKDKVLKFWPFNSLNQSNFSIPQQRIFYLA